jgi:hypothetical protein
VESYLIASDYASSFINARGAFLIVKLYDVLNRVREVVVHGAHYGAIVALAAAQISTGHALHFAPQQISPDRSEEYRSLIDSYYITIGNTSSSLLSEDIIDKLYTA